MAMVRAATAQDGPAFDQVLEEMIPSDMRERLFVSAGMLGQTLAD